MSNNDFGEERNDYLENLKEAGLSTKFKDYSAQQEQYLEKNDLSNETLPRKGLNIMRMIASPYALMGSSVISASTAMLLAYKNPAIAAKISTDLKELVESNEDINLENQNEEFKNEMVESLENNNPEWENIFEDLNDNAFDNQYRQGLDPELQNLGYTPEEIAVIMELKERIGEENTPAADLDVSYGNDKKNEIDTKDLTEDEIEVLQELSQRIASQPKPDFQSMYENRNDKKNKLTR